MMVDDQAMMIQALLSLLPRRPRDDRYHGPKHRGDGHDEARIISASNKRIRRGLIRLEQRPWS